VCSRSVFFRRRERSEIEAEENSREFFFGGCFTAEFLLFFGGAKGDAREPGGRLEIVGRGPGGVKYEGGAYGEDSAAGGGGGAGGLFLVMSCVGVAGLE